MRGHSDSPVPSVKVPQDFSDPPAAMTPAETPNAKRHRWVLSNISNHTFRPKTSFPPGPKSSIGLALSLLGAAASSAMGIPNPYHRTGVILICAILLYVIGLRTPTPKGH